MEKREDSRLKKVESELRRRTNRLIFCRKRKGITATHFFPGPFYEKFFFAPKFRKRREGVKKIQGRPPVPKDTRVNAKLGQFCKKNKMFGKSGPFLKSPRSPPLLLLWQISYFSSLPETSGTSDILCINGKGKRTLENLSFFATNKIKRSSITCEKAFFALQPFPQGAKAFLLRAEIRLYVSGSRRGSLAWHPP